MRSLYGEFGIWSESVAEGLQNGDQSPDRAVSAPTRPTCSAVAMSPKVTLGQLGGQVQVLRVVTLASRGGRYGGPWDTATRQSLLMARDGHEVRLIAGVHGGERPNFEPGSVRRLIVPVRKWLPTPGFTAFFSVRIAVAIWRAVGESDLVHVSASREAIPVWAALSAIVRGRALVLQPHGMLTARTSLVHRAVDLVMRGVVRSSDEVIALTSQEQDQLRDWLRQDKPAIRVIGNPIALELDDLLVHPRALDGSPIRVSFIARLHARKRALDFAAAAAIAAANGSRSEWTIGGPDGGELREVKQRVSFTANLHYVGALAPSEVTDLLEDTDVFVLCSWNEPWGNVLVAALTLAVPVIVTESSALAALVREYAAGEVVPDASPAAMAAALDRLTSDAETYERTSRAARRLAREKFAQAGVARDLAATYNRVLQTHGT